MSLRVDSHKNREAVQAPQSNIKPTLFTRVWSKVTDPAYLTSGVCAVGASVLAGCSLPVSAAVGGGAYLGWKVSKNIFLGGKTLRPAVFLGTEHLSEKIEGGFEHYNIPVILNTLKKLPQSQRVVEAQQKLLDIYTYKSHFDLSGIGNGPLITQTLASIKDLQPGQSVAIPCGWAKIGDSWGHAMAMVIKRNENGSYLIQVHNGGEGVTKFHYSATDRCNRKLYQTVLEIDGVAFENIAKTLPEIARLHSYRQSNSTDKLYKEILPLFKGKILSERRIPEFWSIGQMGGSCSGYCLRSILKTTLSIDERYLFKTQFIADTSHALFKEMSRGSFFEKSEHHLEVLKESIFVLSKRKNKDKCQISEEVRALMDGRLNLPRISKLGKLAQKTSNKFWGFVFKKSETKKYKVKPPNNYFIPVVSIAVQHPLCKLQNKFNMINIVHKDPHKQKELLAKMRMEVEKLNNAVKGKELNKNTRDMHAVFIYGETETLYVNCCRAMREFNEELTGSAADKQTSEVYSAIEKFLWQSIVYFVGNHTQSEVGASLEAFNNALRAGNLVLARKNLEEAYADRVKLGDQDYNPGIWKDLNLAKEEFEEIVKSKPNFPLTLEERDLCGGMAFFLNEGCQGAKFHEERHDYSNLRLYQYFPRTPWAMAAKKTNGPSYQLDVTTPTELTTLINAQADVKP